MSRTIWKGPYLQKSVIELINIKTTEMKKAPRIISRKAAIVPFFLEKKVLIYNGKTFINLEITSDMIGHKFGEFAPTRKMFTYKKKKK